MLKKLPDTIDFEGITFNLSLLHASDEMRLSYSILTVDEKSPHYATFEKEGAWISIFSGSLQYYLFAESGIKNLDDLRGAVQDLYDKLKRRKLITEL